MKNREQIIKEHEEILYPTVRIRSGNAGGSGLIIYSRPKPDNPEEYETYVTSCYHVIENSINFVDKWSPLAQRMIKVEDRSIIQVEIFEYEKLSKIVGGTTYNAEIVAWDKELDLTLLKILSTKKFPYVAKLYPKGEEDNILLGKETIACGCSLGHAPIMNYGNLMAKHDMIENKEYWLSTADTIFGNSGGSEFLDDEHQFIGVTARISGIQLGFSVDIITWMGFVVPISSVYKFFDEQLFMFLYDDNYTSKQCNELREQKRKDEERKLYLPPDMLGPSKGK